MKTPLFLKRRFRCQLDFMISMMKVFLSSINERLIFNCNQRSAIHLYIFNRLNRWVCKLSFPGSATRLNDPADEASAFCSTFDADSIALLCRI